VFEVPGFPYLKDLKNFYVVLFEEFLRIHFSANQGIRVSRFARIKVAKL
jgi:hypothetical protein